MIGEDGRMTDAAPASASRAWRRWRRARRWSPSCASAGWSRGDGALHARRAVLAPLGRAHRAADLAAVVHAHGRAGRARPSRPCATGQLRITPERWSRGLPRLAREHPALVHLAPALVGPPDPGLVPRRRDLRRRASRREGEGWERDPDVLDTWFSQRAVAVRDARLARGDAAAARLLPDRRARHRARHHLPLGRPDGDVRARVHRRAPVRGRLHPLGDPGPRRAPDVEVARHRHRPAGRDRRRTAPTRVRFGLLAMSSTQDVRYSAEKVAQGAPAGQQALERVAALSCSACPTTPGAERAAARRSRTAGSSRACSARRGRRAQRARRASTSPAPRSASTTSSTASCATGTSSWSSRGSTTATTDAAATLLLRARARRSRSPTR